MSVSVPLHLVGNSFPTTEYISLTARKASEESPVSPSHLGIAVLGLQMLSIMLSFACVPGIRTQVFTLSWQELYH